VVREWYGIVVVEHLRDSRSGCWGKWCGRRLAASPAARHHKKKLQTSSCPFFWARQSMYIPRHAHTPKEIILMYSGDRTNAASIPSHVCPCLQTSGLKTTNITSRIRFDLNSHLLLNTVRQDHSYGCSPAEEKKTRMRRTSSTSRPSGNVLIRAVLCALLASSTAGMYVHPLPDIALVRLCDLII